MNSYNKTMMHDRELISDAKKQIHRVDEAKKKSMANYGSPMKKKGCSSKSPLKMGGSWMSKHCKSR
jgi:hypothetical protein